MSTLLASPERAPAPGAESPRSAPPRSARRVAGWWAVVTALVLWVVSLPRVDLHGLGPWGLLPALPATWYAALALLLGSFAVALHSPRPRHGWLGAHVAALVVVLYGTLPLVADTPRYYWAYKHIGVARYIVEHGSVDRGIDIYQRWPGFFALVAALSRVGGIDPMQLARGAELFFAGVNAALVVALARAFFKDMRYAAVAGAVFSLANWVGQGYFAPQALAYTFALGVGLLAVRSLTSPAGKVGQRLERLVAAVTRSPRTAQQLRPVGANAGSRRGAAVAATGLFAAAVVSHQLTPYVLLLGLGVTAALGYLRPRWLVAVMAGIAVLYLAPNLGYVEHSQGLLTSFNPFRNAAMVYSPDSVLPAKIWRSTATFALTWLVWLLAAVGVAREARRRLSAGTLLAALAASPALLLFLQSYGGEARLRVVLFTLPWCALAISRLWGMTQRLRRPVATAITALALGIQAALFLPAFYGDEDANYVRATEVAASEWVSSHAPAGSVLLLASPGFPLRAAGSYTRLVGPTSDNVPSLATAHLDLQGASDGEVADQVATYARRWAPTGFVVFATSGERYADTYDLFQPLGVRGIEEAVRRSGAFTEVFRNSDVRIYAVAAGSSGSGT